MPSFRAKGRCGDPHWGVARRQVLDILPLGASVTRPSKIQLLT